MATASTSSEAIVGFETQELAKEIPESSGSVSIVSTPVHGNGTRACEIDVTTTGDPDWIKIWGRNIDGKLAEISIGTLYLAFAINFSAIPSASYSQCVRVEDTGNNIKAELRIGAGGVLRLYDSTGAVRYTSTTLVSSGWHVVGLEVQSGGSPDAKFYVDGTLESSPTGGFGANNTAHVFFGSATNPASSSSEYTMVVDDIVFRDDQQPAHDLEVLLFLPNSQTGCETDWDGDYTDVDEAPPLSEADYIERDYTGSSGDAETMTFNVSDLNSDDTIEGIVNFGWIACESNPFIGYGNSKLKLVSGSTTDYGDPFPVTSSAYASYGKVYFDDPDDSAAWEKTDLEAVKLGIEAHSVPSFDTYAMRNAAAWMMVARSIPVTGRRVGIGGTFVHESRIVLAG